jgi:exopolysaccharide biosynthesis polyprenyl glycosylphosphotransferase
VRLLVDAIVLIVAAAAAVLGATGLDLGWQSRLVGAAYPLLVLVVLHARGNRPNDRISSSLVQSLAHILGVISLCAMLVIAAESILGVEHPVALALRLWVFSIVYLSIARASLRSVRMALLGDGKRGTPTLVVGAGVIGEHLTRRLLENPFYGLRPVGMLDADPLLRSGWDTPDRVPLIDSSTLLDAVRETGAQQVVVAFSSEPDGALVEALEGCRRRGIEVALVPRMFELVNERSTLDHVGGVPLLSLRPTNPQGWQFAVKHALDSAVAAIALIALAPLFAVIAIAIRSTSPGPVFFRQRRVGRDGREFELLKFRSMTNERAASDERDPPAGEFDRLAGLAPGGVEGSDRRTPLGRLLRRSSLDELPQLINVLRSEMSIIGPRPERPEFVELFATEVYRYENRHRVRSGITGWAQVHGLRGQTSIAERVEADNFYIQNWSLRLDLQIVLLTVAEILRFRDNRDIQLSSALRAGPRAMEGDLDASAAEIDHRDDRYGGAWAHRRPHRL